MTFKHAMKFVLVENTRETSRSTSELKSSMQCIAQIPNSTAREIEIRKALKIEIGRRGHTTFSPADSDINVERRVGDERI